MNDDAPPAGRRGHMDAMWAASVRKRAESRGAPPPAIPPGTDWRPIRGFPGFYIDRDKAVWTYRNKGGYLCPWRRAGLVLKGRHHKTPSVCLRGPDGRVSLVSVAKLHREAFLHPELPAGSFLGAGHDDDDERESDALGLPIPRPFIPARTRPPVNPVPPAPIRRPPVRHSPPPITILAPRPPADHPGGSDQRGPMARGSDHGRAVLDEAQVIEARRLRSEGWSTGQLARQFNVGRNTISYALNGTTWSHVPGAINPKGGTSS